MKKQQDNSSGGWALRITVALALVSLSAILLASSFKAAPAPAGAPGSLDPSFASGGKLVNSQLSLGQGVAVDGQGRIVVVAATGSLGSSYNFTVARFNPNGSFDTSFHGTGITGADFSNGGSESYDWPYAVAIDSQGRIVVAGLAGPARSDCELCYPATTDFALARFNTDGTLDTSFGTGGKVLTDVSGNGKPDVAFAMSIDGQGRIVVAGSSGVTTQNGGTEGVFAVARYNSDGSLDASFGSGGITLTDFNDFNSIESEALGVTIDGSGRIVTAGYSRSLAATSVDGNGDQFALARFNSDGILDTSFGTSGKVVDNYGTLSAVTIDSLGRIVASGNSYDGTKNHRDFALARYNSDGSIDTTFGVSGMATASFSSFDDYGFAMTIDSSGRILLAGTASYGAGQPDFALARYNSNGALDTTFGTSGEVTTDFGGSEVGTAMAIDNLGRIVLAGYSGITNPVSLALARYISSSADLSITKSASPNPVLAGGTLTYTIVVTNNGPDATLAAVTDQLPLFVNYLSTSTTQGSCDQANGAVSCALGNLAASATATITIQVQPTGDAAGPISNTAKVQGNDPNVTNNSATANGTVNPAADLSVTKSGSPNPVAGGNNITYTMVVTNNGPSQATNVVLTDPLMDSLVSFSTTSGICSIFKSKGKSTLGCNFGNLDNGAGATVRLVVKSAHKKGTTSNTASVTNGVTDPNTANNTATAVVTIQ